MESLSKCSRAICVVFLSLVLAMGLLPVLPSSAAQADEVSSSSETNSKGPIWTGGATGTATITGLETGVTVTLVQIATTTLESNNTLSSAWVDQGDTNWGTAADGSEGALTIAKYQEDGTDDSGSNFKTDVYNILKYVRANLNTLTCKASGTAGQTVTVTSSTDAPLKISGPNAPDSETGTTTKFTNLPAGLYAVIVTDPNNKTNVYQDMIANIKPQADSSTGGWTLPAYENEVKHGHVGLTKVVGTGSVATAASGGLTEGQVKPSDFTASKLADGKKIASLGALDYAYYRLTTYVPKYDTANWDTETADTPTRDFTITDTIPSGLSFDKKSVVLKAATASSSTAYSSGAVAATAEYQPLAATATQTALASDGTLPSNDYTVSDQSTDGTVTITLTDDGIEDAAGKDLTVLYRAQLLTSASTSETTTSDVTFSSAETGSATGTTGQVDATVITYTMQVKKTDGSNALDGAEFTLYRNYGVSGNTDESANQQTIATLKDEDGNGTFDGTTTQATTLGSGITYTLVESKVPAGYAAIAPVDIVITSATENTTETLATNSKIYNQGTADTTATTIASFDTSSAASNLVVIVNDSESPAGILPGTGGAGTVALTVIGLLAMAAAGVYYRRFRRKNQQNA